MKCRVFGAPEQGGHDGHGIHSRGCTTDAVFRFAGSDGGEGTDAGGSIGGSWDSVRTFQRWAERYEAEGDDGLVDRRLGRRSPRRAPEEELERMLALYRDSTRTSR
ncbi:helix-turn-helix domain-containing protein [Bradyrhizobium sp. USDA 4501]